MGKRIEEFTVVDVSKGIAARYDTFTVNSLIEAILDYIKANLDTGKRDPMSVEEIEKAVQAAFMKQVERHGTMTLSMAIAEEIQPLTVQQGFVVDWHAMPELPEPESLVWVQRRDSIYLGWRNSLPLSTNQDASRDCHWYGSCNPRVRDHGDIGMTSNFSDVAVTAWAYFAKPTPRPAPKMRQKTRDEKIDDLWATKDTSAHAFYAIVSTWFSSFSDAIIDDLCRAAGIPLETPDE